MKHFLDMKLLPINLQLFDDGGGGAGASGGDAGSSAAPAPEQQQQQTATNEQKTVTPAQKAADFEKLIKGDYKAEFDARAQQIIDTRFKDYKALESQAQQLKSLDPVLDLLSTKYGVDRNDLTALTKAMEDDKSYFEDEALKRGMTVEQYKQFRTVERENLELRRASEARQRQEQADQIISRWNQQTEDCKKVYPNFSLEAEATNPQTGKRFEALLKSGVDVRTAYEVIHKDEIMSNAMSYTAQQVQQMTVNDIKARGMRPAENGGSGRGAANMTTNDPSKLTRADREKLARRAMRGERIEL